MTASTPLTHVQCLENGISVQDDKNQSVRSQAEPFATVKESSHAVLNLSPCLKRLSVA